MNIHNFNRRIFLIMQDVLNILNEYYSLCIEFILSEDTEYAAVNWSDIELKNNILLNKMSFIDYYFENEKVDINLAQNIVEYISLVCHEYEHIIQRNYMYKNSNDLSNKYKKDFFVMASFRNFYNMYHDNFYIESEADSYSVINSLEYIKKYLKDSLIDKKSLTKYLNRNNFMKKINNKKFLLLYKFSAICIKTVSLLNVKSSNLIELEESYKLMKKTYE